MNKRQIFIVIVAFISTFVLINGFNFNPSEYMFWAIVMLIGVVTVILTPIIFPYKSSLEDDEYNVLDVFEQIDKYKDENN